MAPHELNQERPFVQQLVFSLALMLIGVGVLVLLIFVGLDARCAADIERGLPYYPQAELVSSEHTHWRLRGMGNSTVILSSSDTVQQIRRWYVDYAVDTNPPPSQFAVTRYNITANPNGGSTITLTSRCAALS